MNRAARLLTAAALAALAAAAAACGDAGPAPPPVVLATTTTIEDSGLLDALVPAARAATGVEVKPVVMGSGEALALARRGEVDILLTHSPAAEGRFVKDGFGLARTPILRNDFVVVGPEGDPAGVRGAGSAVEAFARIGRAAGEGRALFVSRADGSGTHVREQDLWRKAGARPPAARLVETGAGQGATVRVADERGGYALCDRATFAAIEGQVSLRVHVEGGAGLENIYSAVLVAPARVVRGNAEGARRLHDFLTGEGGRGAAAGAGRDRAGRPLFEWIGPAGPRTAP